MTILEHITKARELAFKAKVLELIGDDAYNSIELALAKASTEVRLAAPKKKPVAIPAVPVTRLKSKKAAV